jgi:hypothetical protein
MAHKLTLEIPDDVYKLLCHEANEVQSAPEELATEWLIATIQRIGNDPLMQLAGTFESEVTDAGERHDYYIGQALMQETRDGDSD